MKISHFLLLIIAALAMMTISAAAVSYTRAALDDEVIDLPDAPKYTRQFAGYLPVFNNTQMFYWFIQAEKNPETAPVLMWTSGGPGCSGLIGKLTEMGPYAPRAKQGGGAKLELRDVAWTREFNMFFIEQPDVGFTNIDSGFAPREWTDGEIAKRNADAIEQFFLKFPQFKSNGFGISSESYGGHYIPTLARELIARINAGKTEINFKWSIVGNPLIYLPQRDYGQYVSQIERQLIPRYPYGEEYMTKCRPDPKQFPNPPAPRPSICNTLESKMDAYTGRVDPYAMSFPICVDSRGQLRSAGGDYHDYIIEQIAKAQSHYKSQTLLNTKSIHETAYQAAKLSSEKTGNSLVDELVRQMVKAENKGDGYFPAQYEPCEEDYTTAYLNRPDVQKALHANLKRSRWSMCQNIRYSNFDFVESMLPVYQSNAQNGPQVRQLIFSGSDDTMCSTVEAQITIFNNWTVKTFWSDIVVDGQLAGHKSTFENPSNLVFATVHGAGHMAPSTRPGHTLEIVKRFIENKL